MRPVNNDHFICFIITLKMSHKINNKTYWSFLGTIKDGGDV